MTGPQEFLGLPEDRRIELLDGELLVGPSPRRSAQRLSSRLWAALDAGATPGHEGWRPSTSGWRPAAS